MVGRAGSLKLLEQCSNTTVEVLRDCQSVSIRQYFRKPTEFLVSHILSSGKFTPTCTKRLIFHRVFLVK